MNFMNKERPYYTVHDFYQDKFKDKVLKVSLNGDFTCPNRDGSISYQGCIFCSESGSGDFAGDKSQPIHEQYQTGLKKMRQKWPSGKTIAYFQANTNTYGTLDKIKGLFNEALTLDDNLVGISIATRPDCISDEVLDYLGELNQKTFVTVELGLQTIHEDTIHLINRGHDTSVFVDSVKRLRSKNIHVVCHIINGLPFETEEMMLETLRFCNQVDIQGIKIHMLYIQKKTPLADYYAKTPFPILSLEEYVRITVRQIEIMRPDLIIYRLTGDSDRNELIEPLWSLKKFVVTNEIDKRLRSQSSYQGKYYQP